MDDSSSLFVQLDQDQSNTQGGNFNNLNSSKPSNSRKSINKKLIAIISIVVIVVLLFLAYKYGYISRLSLLIH